MANGANMDRVIVPSLETPTLTKAELADLLFERLGLNKRESKDMVEAFFEENGGDWPVVLDTDGRIATDWGVARVPESYLVSPSGQVRAKIVGGIEDLAARLVAPEARIGKGIGEPEDDVVAQLRARLRLDPAVHRRARVAVEGSARDRRDLEPDQRIRGPRVVDGQLIVNGAGAVPSRDRLSERPSDPRLE